MTYRRRVIDDLLDELQPALAAIEIHGPKGVGKTETASRRAHSILSLDLAAERQRFEADPTLWQRLPGPLLIDEWQRHPESWDRVRRAVDAGAPRGHFILTGSASAPRGVAIHTGAGRIVGFRMRPMTLSERGVGSPTVSLAEMLGGHASIGGETEIRLAEYAEAITGSGFPDVYGESERARRPRLDAYLDTLLHREFAEHGYPVRRPRTLRAWLAAYAAATGTTASYNSILDAATGGESEKPSKVTTIAYRDVLDQLWMLDPLEPWLPTTNRLHRLTQAPKHYLADPALAARLLGINTAGLLTGRGDAAGVKGGSVLGALFEHLVVLSLKVFAANVDAGVLHLRTRGGEREIDAIVEGDDGRVVAIEVKLSQSVTGADVRHLRWLKESIGDDLVDAAVITTGEYAYRRNDGIAVIPAALLGP